MHAPTAIARSLEFTADELRQMADDVVARCVDHVAAAGEQPSCGDVDAEELCRAMREPAPERGTALGDLLDTLFTDYIPRSFTTIWTALPPSHGRASTPTHPPEAACLTALLIRLLTQWTRVVCSAATGGVCGATCLST